MKLSLWGFHWNQGKPEPCAAPQAAVLRAHEEGKQQEGGRLLRAFTAPSMQSNVAEITEWLDAHESIVFDPVSIPWNGLRIGQVAGRAAKHVGPGVAIDWFEIEGPIHPIWPPESHRRLFGDLPIEALPPGSEVVPPPREEVRSIGGYVPSMHFDLTRRNASRSWRRCSRRSRWKTRENCSPRFCRRPFGARSRTKRSSLTWRS